MAASGMLGSEVLPPCVASFSSATPSSSSNWPRQLCPKAPQTLLGSKSASRSSRGVQLATFLLCSAALQRRHRRRLRLNSTGAALAPPVMIAKTTDLDDPAFWQPVVALRREIHMHPEPGFMEYGTVRRIKKVLVRHAGIPESQMRVLCKTGLIVDIQGRGPPSHTAPVHCVALRSDLDALAIVEGNEHLPYRSQNQGMAHLCGHDGHIAALVGAATALSWRADRIPSNCTVRLLFQPAEETPGGAEPMIKEGCLEGVDEVYGWHNWTAWPVGTLAVKAGAVMAHEAEFFIKIMGQGAHGAAPERSVDPVVCAAQIVTSLQTIVSRNISPHSVAVVSVTMIHAGDCNNVIPDHAEISGTIRDLSQEVFLRATEVMERMVPNIAEGFGCTATVKVVSGYPETINNAKATEVVQRCAKRPPHSLEVTDSHLPLMGTEDFSYYLQHRPGCFFFLGTKEDTTQGLADFPGCNCASRTNCVPHGTSFDFNDNVLPLAVSLYLKIIEDRFGVKLFDGFEE